MFVGDDMTLERNPAQARTDALSQARRRTCARSPDGAQRNPGPAVPLLAPFVELIGLSRIALRSIRATGLIPDCAIAPSGLRALACARASFRCGRNEDPMAAKKLNYRLPILIEDKLDDAQRALLQSLRAGPRGDRVKLGGPFGVYMHAPQYGELTQQLGAFLRFKTSLEPRLSEFAILCTARIWRSEKRFAGTFSNKPEASSSVRMERMRTGAST